MRSDAHDLAGIRFGRLVAVSYAGYRKGTMWECLCDCGRFVITKAQALKLGATRSCGCYNAERRAELKTVHGLSEHPSYKSWSAMIRRCTDPADKDYPAYGGRGICVFGEWLDVAQFIRDMGPKPDGASLERINNHGNYEKNNCRWATALEQGSNKRNNKLITHNGRTLHLAEWARELGEPESTLSNRLKAGRAIDHRLRKKPTCH